MLSGFYIRRLPVLRFAVLALALFAVGGAAFAAPGEHGAQTPEQSQSGDSIVPPLVRDQQALYQRLRNRLWNRRNLPAGLPEPTAPVTPRDSNVGAVGIAARNIDFVLDDGIGYHVERLRGALVPVNGDEPVNFDNPEQYRIRIFSGEVLVRPRELDALFNRYLLTHEPRSLSTVDSRTSEGELTVDVGARLFRFMPPVGGMPTTLRGAIKVTGNNRLVFAPQSVQSLGLPLEPVLSALGLDLATLTPFDRPGIQLKGDRLIMNPERLFPPPRLAIDNISDVRLTDAGLRLTFSSRTSDAGFDRPPVASDSYIWLQSGDARFYRVLLVNTRVAVLSSSDEPLDFHLYDYRAQAAAGSIRIRRDGTHIIRVPNTFEDTDDHPERTIGRARRPGGGDR